jgi:guanine deaminase
MHSEKHLMPDDFMRQAIALALENIRSGGGPFAAVIAKDGALVASGANRVTAANDPTAHAEIEAIRAACRKLQSFQLDRCQLYSTCEPCPMCLGAIYWARPEHVYYAATAADAAAAGFDDAFIYRELQVPQSGRRIGMTRLLYDEAESVFRAWQAKSDKTAY